MTASVTSILSKIENGHYRVRRGAYRELMGRVAEMRYMVWLKSGGRLPEDGLW